MLRTSRTLAEGTSRRTPGFPAPNGPSRSSSSASSRPMPRPPTIASTCSVRAAPPGRGRPRRGRRRPAEPVEPPRRRARARPRPGGRRSARGARRTLRARRAGRSRGCCGPSPRPSPSLVERDQRSTGRQWRSARREATMPTTPGCQPRPATDQRRRFTQLVRQVSPRGLGARLDLALGAAALMVGAVELGGDLLGAPVVRGQEQLDPGVGPVEPARGVDPRGQAEGEVASSRPAGSHPAAAISARSPGRAAAACDLEAPPHQGPVLARAAGRRRPRSRGRPGRDRPRRSAGAPAARRSAAVSFQATAVPQSSANGYPPRAGCSDQASGQLALGLMVVGDDQLDARSPRPARTSAVSGDAAVDREQQVGSALRAARRRFSAPIP